MAIKTERESSGSNYSYIPRLTVDDVLQDASALVGLDILYACCPYLGESLLDLTAFSVYTGPDLLCSKVFFIFSYFFNFLFWVVR